MVKVTLCWAFEVDRGPDWLLVRVGRPSGQTEKLPSLADSLWSLMEQHFAHRLVLELDRFGALDEDLVDQLLQLHNRIDSHSGMMRVCGLSPYNRHLLWQLGLDDRFVPYADREAAVLGSDCPRHPR